MQNKKEKIRNSERDLFGTRTGFVLACIGSAVGMGNIWRFPNMVSTYGGLTFILPYFLFVILIGCTGIVEEMALGRAAGSGPVGAFGRAAGTRGKEKVGRVAGVVPVAGSLALAIGYTVVMGWIIKYTYLAFSGGLEAMGQDMGVIGTAFGVTADSWGANIWIVFAALAAFAIMAFGVSAGIENANKIMMPVLFFLFVILGVYIAFLPGASDGYKYIFTFNGSGLTDPKVWIYAFGQAFFSLSIAGSGTVIYGSYLNKEEDIPKSARNVAVFDTLAALLAAMVIIPAMATSGEKLSAGGPGLMFIYLVNVMNGMGSAGRIVSMIFFTCVLFAGVSSIINLYESPVAFLQDELKLKRVPATGIMLAAGCTAALCIQHITSQWMDVVSIYICPVGALFAGIMFFWVLKKEDALEAANSGAGKKVGNVFYNTGKYVYVTLTLAALIAGAALGGIG